MNDRVALLHDCGFPLFLEWAKHRCVLALYLVTLSVSTGAFFDLLVVAATYRCNCLCVMTSSLDGA